MRERASTWLRLATALTLAPIVAALACSALYTLLAALVNGEPFIGGWALVPLWIWTIAAYMVILSAPVILLIGLPVHHSLMRAKRTGFWTYVSAGGTFGLIAGGVLLLSRQIDLLGMVLLGVLYGAATTAIAWLIRRPDRDAASPPTPAP
jgi:hypothetical protein